MQQQKQKKREENTIFGPVMGHMLGPVMGHMQIGAYSCCVDFLDNFVLVR